MAWVSDPSCESKSYEIMTEEGDESTTSGIWIIIDALLEPDRIPVLEARRSTRARCPSPDVRHQMSNPSLSMILSDLGLSPHGFVLGDLIDDLLNEKDLLPELGQEVENIVCALDKDIQGAAATVATVLRIKGQTVDLELESKPLKWVFKRAARINARRLVLVEKTEWEDGSVY
ncbi:hypothetical protein YC2023_053072 [Brassica napus]